MRWNLRPRGRGRVEPPDPAGSARLSLEEIGALGAHYVSRPPDWIRRHVETLTLRNEWAGVRRLTIDIVLPVETGASVSWSDGRRLYYVPLATVAKRPARTNLDFTDETGKSLPVLNRRESVEFSGLLRRPFEWADVRRGLIVGLWVAVFAVIVSEPFWRRGPQQAIAEGRVPQQDQVEDARLEMGAEG